MIKKREHVLLIISVMSFLLFSISFLLMPIENSLLMIVSGAMFWASLIVGIITQILLSVNIKKWKQQKRGKLKRHLKRSGLLSFFSNPLAKVFDITMVVGVIGLIISMIATQSSGYICYVFIAITVFSFSSHCIFNGKNYYYIKNADKLICLSNGEEQK